MSNTATLEELEAKVAARKASRDVAKAAQELVDRTALAELQLETEDDLVTLRLGIYRDGLPVFVAARPPTEPEFRRYSQMVRRSKGDAEMITNAQELLADTCWVYPPKSEADLRKAVKLATPSILLAIAVQLVKQTEAKAADEGKD
jgi:hypothetical protein